MDYTLVTFPNCYVCEDVKDFLKDKGINYREISPITQETKKEWGKIYQKIPVPLKKDDKGTIMPILVGIKESNIEQIAQGEEIKAIF